MQLLHGLKVSECHRWKQEHAENRLLALKPWECSIHLLHGETAFLANVAQKIVVNEVMLGDESGFEDKHKVIFKEPRTVDYRANVHDIAKYLMILMTDAALARKNGQSRQRTCSEKF